MLTKILAKISILITVLLLIYFSRWTLFYKFNSDYWENFYYESQWNIPNSQRIIPDEGVYRFVGYKLTQGENPFDIDYWVPPGGKYIYGLSANFFNNPYFASLAFYLATILTTYLLSCLFFKHNFEKTLTSLLVATNPLIVDQITKTMLDLPQALFLLIHILFIISFSKHKKTNHLFLSGFFLGLALGTKIGYFIPAVLIIDLVYLLKNKTNQKFLLFFLLFSFLGYVSTYFCYFIKHPNPIPWLRLHQKIINFWKGTRLIPGPYNFFSWSFANKFFQVLDNKRIWMNSNTWSIIFPTAVCTIFLNIFKKHKHKNISYLYFLSVTWIILITLIDFWPRYIVPITTIFILLLVKALEKKKILLLLIFLINIMSLKNFISPDPNSTKKQINQHISNQSYKELYQLSFLQDINQEDFVSLWQSLNLYQPNMTSRQQDKNTFVININDNKIELLLSKINNQWKITNYNLGNKLK